MNEANKTQVGGTHYASNYQHWDWAAAMFGSGYFKGAITKYVARWRKKSGVEDLQKARHYLVKLIELVESGKVSITQSSEESDELCMTVDFCNVNRTAPSDSMVITGVTCATDKLGLVIALGNLDYLIEKASSAGV